ncbi:MAG: hypothetical protein ACTSU9_16345 [Promethearchaeota archaeon]
MSEQERNPEKDPIDLEDLLREIEKPKELNELLNDIIEDEMEREFALKQEKKQTIIKELINASKIYEKMPLERLGIKLNVDMNEILDLLEEIILKNEFTGIIISGKEIIFKTIPNHDDLDQKPFHVMKPAKPGIVPASNVATGINRIKPLQRKKIDLKFKVLGDHASGASKEEEIKNQQAIEGLTIDTHLKLVTSQVQLRINLINSTNQVFNEILVKFITSKNIRLLRTKPQYKSNSGWGNELNVASIPANSSRRILLYFSLQKCEPIEINILVQYRDAIGNYLDENITEKIVFNEPRFSKSKEITDREFQGLIQEKLKFKGIKSFGMPEHDPVEVYLIMKELLVINSFELVGEKLIEDEGRFIGWYYANYEDDADGAEDRHYIVIAQIINRKVEFFAICNDAVHLVCGLAYLSNQLIAELSKRGIIKQRSELIELYCMSCGGTLSRYPESGEVYQCKFCGANLVF